MWGDGLFRVLLRSWTKVFPSYFVIKSRNELSLNRFEELRLMLKKRFRSQVLCHGFESGMSRTRQIILGSVYPIKYELERELWTFNPERQRLSVLDNLSPWRATFWAPVRAKNTHVGNHHLSIGRNDFEVHVNGVVIFSKRRTGYFPDLDLIVTEVRMALEDPSHMPRTVTETESCCSFRYTSCCQVRSVCD